MNNKSLGVLMSLLMLIPAQTQAKDVESVESLLSKSAGLRLELEQAFKSKAKEKKEDVKPVKVVSKADGVKEMPETVYLDVKSKPQTDDKVVKVEKKADKEAGETIIVNQNELLVSDVDSDMNYFEDEMDEKMSAGKDCANFEYRSGEVNTIFVRPGFVTDIALSPGEYLERMTLGDNTPFDIKTFLNAQSDGAWHIYVNPSQKGIETNMIIITDRRTYQVRLISGDIMFPFVKWNVKDDIRNMTRGEKLKNKDGFNLAVKDIKDLHFDYAKSAKSNFRWAPQHVFDDKHWTTYFSFEKGKLKSINPMIFTENSSGVLVVVPYEKSGDTIVIRGVRSNLVVKNGNDIIKYYRK